MMRRRHAWAILVAAAATACGGGQRAQEAGREQPERAAMPQSAQRYIHRTFHRFERVCTPRTRDEDRLDDATARFIGLYRRYPPERFALEIDGERGTMLSAILVLRYELSRCSRRHAAAVDRVLPPDVRRALTPLR